MAEVRESEQDSKNEEKETELSPTSNGSKIEHKRKTVQSNKNEEKETEMLPISNKGKIE
jgi:hypothetical protein